MAGTISSSMLEKFTNFGDLLRFLRRRAGITQIDLSIAVGYSDGQISRLEQNLRLPDLFTLQARFIPALDLEEEPQAVARLLELAVAVRREDAPGPGVCPYKGLSFFDEVDADLFTGREDLTAMLVERVLSLATNIAAGSQRFLAVAGASGSGKSSLVRAGLVPALRWHAASANWPITILTPTAHPLESLVMSLIQDQGSLAGAAALVDDLAHEPRSLGLFLKHKLKPADGSHILLVIDQFEEIFSLCRSEEERSAFIENVLAAAGDGDGPALVVITLRADFYVPCAGYPQLRQALARQQEFIGPMNAEELRRAIEEPARRGRWELEEGLVDLLLREVGQEPGALPLLSHALLETWQRRRGRTLTLSGYAASGGVRGAIAETAEALFTDRFNHNQREIARRIFLRLTELGDETTAGDNRRRAVLSELIINPLEEEETLMVLKALADARLIITSSDAAEVAHEALIREWPTLRGWLEENREGLRLHRHLTEAAQEWLSIDREPDALYRGARLAQAREWAVTHTADMNALEKEFLEASLVEAEREVAEREAQRQRELDAARKLAEAEERRANELRRRAWYLIGALALALGLAFAAIYLGGQARQAATAAQGQQRVAFSRELAAASISNLTVDPERSILLSLEAVQLADTREAENALHLAVQSSRIRRTLQVGQGDVVGVDFSRDGKRLATAGLDGSIRIWDPVSGEVLNTLTGHSAMINTVTYSPDGSRLASASDDGTAKVWDALSGQELMTLAGHSGYVTAVVFSPDGEMIMTVGEDKTIRLWDAHSGKAHRVISGHSAMIRGIALSSDGSQIVTASDDHTARIWDANSGQAILTLAGHTGEVMGVAFSPDGKYIATASGDATVKLWDASSGEELQTLTSHTNIVQGIAFSPKGDFLATGGYDGRVIIWSIPSGKEIFSLSGRAVQIYRVAFSPNGQQLATANSDGTTQLWDVTPGEEYLTFTGHSEIVNSVLYSPDGKRLLTASGDGTAALWDARTGQSLVWLRGHTSSVIRAVFNKDGSRVATASDDLTARIWDASTGKELVRFSGHTIGTNSSPFSGVLDAAYNPDNTRLATAGSDATIRIWDADSGKELMQLNGHSERVNSIVYSLDGARLASGGDDTTVKLWDTASGNEIMTLKGHTLRVWRVVYSPDGATLASSSTDGTVILWDAQTGEQIQVLSGHTSTIATVVFSPQGDRLASVSVDGTAKIWDPLSGDVLLSLNDHHARVTGVAYSPDGSLLATSNEYGTVRIDFLQIQDLIGLAKSRLTRSLSVDECQQYLHLETCPAAP